MVIGLLVHPVFGDSVISTLSVISVVHAASAQALMVMEEAKQVSPALA